MTLQEAIAHARATAGRCGEGSMCARDHEQLADWLEELEAYKATGLSPLICSEYKKFEDEAVSKGVPFSRIIELMEADRDGRVVVLLCRMDAVVYAARCYYRGKKVYRQEIVSGEIDHFTIGEAMKPIATVCFSDNDWEDYEPDELIFTREEAEKFLEEV